jgi:hypothetical protein
MEAPKILSPAKISALAATEYARDAADDSAVFPYSPARATNAISKRKGSPPKSRIVGIVAEAYYLGNGTASPLPAPRSGKWTPATVRSAVRKRRDAGGRLGRWEVVAYSLSAALGRAVSVSETRAFYLAAGGSDDASYTGRGTRAGAPATRGSETVAVDSTL